MIPQHAQDLREPELLARSAQFAELKAACARQGAMTRLFTEGWCVVDGLLAPAESAALYTHFTRAVREGAIPHVSEDACNVGCASKLLPLDASDREHELEALGLPRGQHARAALDRACALLGGA